MEDLIKYQNDRIKALEIRNAYLENELRQAKQLFQDIVNDWEVANAEEVKPNVLDEMFDNPLQKLNNLF
jgi:uncharacterized protein (DUF3084 family)